MRSLRNSCIGRAITDGLRTPPVSLRWPAAPAEMHADTFSNVERRVAVESERRFLKAFTFSPSCVLENYGAESQLGLRFSERVESHADIKYGAGEGWASEWTPSERTATLLCPDSRIARLAAHSL